MTTTPLHAAAAARSYRQRHAAALAAGNTAAAVRFARLAAAAQALAICAE